MENRVLCSIIIPVYNCPAGIAERCFSCLKELKTPAEILLMDDGSEEPYRNVLEKASEQHPPIKYFPLEHRGVSHARNCGIEEASGQYIVFCDIDDCIDAAILDQAFASLDDTIDLLCCSYRKVRAGKESAVHYGEPFTLDSLLKNPTIYGTVWGKIYRRDCIGDIRFREELSLAEDTVFLTEFLLQRPRTETADLPYYCYQLSTESTARQTQDALPKFFRFFEVIHSLLQNEPEEIRRLAGNCCIVNVNVLMNYFVFTDDNAPAQKKELFRRIMNNPALQQSVSEYDPAFPAKYRLIAFLLRKKAYHALQMIFRVYQRM
ncbi:MAG: glycosyltransferase [Erysipelotrichaceae bacterium]|nr:glycosyltransferase [Erysipelotrichaceae bacterium]